MKLLFIGHASMRLTLDSGFVVYIDPFYPGDYSLPADLILITHEHFDHNRTDLVSLKKSGRILRAEDFLPSYKTVTVNELTVSAVKAYNKNHSEGCVGYVLEVQGMRLYFAGDTSKTDDMAKMKDIDYAFLPIDGVYNMNAEEATECASLIGAKHSVPIHTEKPDERFNEKIVKRFTPMGKLVIRPGDEITL